MAATPKPGSIVHVEFHSRDPARTKKFYSGVFGWKFQEIPEMEYATFEAPSGPGGGVTRPMEGMQPGVLNYILSASIERTSERIERAGGTILVPKSEIPNVGWFAIFRDPEGTVNALYQPKGRPRSRRPPRRPSRARAARTRRRRPRK